MKRMVYFFSILLFCAIGYLATPLKAMIVKNPNLPSLWSRWTTSFGDAYFVEVNGLIPYCIYTFVNHITFSETITREEQKEITNFYFSKEKFNNDKTLIDYSRKNLIVIIVESLNSWILNQKIDGIEITLRLNSFLKEDSAITALRVFPQIKDGRSSDGHLIINTGLLPLKSGAAATLSKTKHFPSLARALKEKGYYSVNIISDKRCFWNQEGISKAYAFDTLYDKTRLNNNDLQRGTISDKSLMQQSFEIIKILPKPFHCQIVTSSTHGPYDESPINRTWISDSQQFSFILRNYMEAFHYTDHILHSFS